MAARVLHGRGPDAVADAVIPIIQPITLSSSGGGSSDVKAALTVDATSPRCPINGYKANNALVWDLQSAVDRLPAALRTPVLIGLMFSIYGGSSFLQVSQRGPECGSHRFGSISLS